MLLPAQTFGGVFLTPEIPHTCVLPPGATPLPLSDTNTTSSSTFTNSTEPEKVSQCEYVMVVNDTEQVQQCTEWHFDNTTYGTTLTEEFELVCGNGFMRPVYQSIYFFGAFFGSPASGCLADRSAAGIIVFLPWTFGLMILGGLAYLYRNWRYLVLTTSLPLLLLLPLQWFLDESPRWLIVRGHHDRALQVLQKAARWNNTSLPPEHQLRKLMTDITEESMTNKTGRKRGIIAWIQNIFNQLYILIRTRMMRRISLCVFLSMLVTGLAYYGLSIGGETFNYSPYVYMALSGVMEIPGATVAIPIVNTFGRRKSNVFCYTVAGLVILSLYFIPKSIVWLSVTLAMMGKLTISAAFQILLLHSTELFPTEVRIRGSGTASMMSKTGSFIAPFITQSLRDVWLGAPSVVLGSSALLGAVSTFLLPETKGVPLYDTVATLESEALNWSERQNKKNKSNPKVRSTFTT
ncbi:hypothetical protein Pcinc_010055 [Petrolisthes cinctipes]|uniref:Organic cation transporter protein n=1 Tax=Petrolisthes cinctipes TaxID=88211 RepID=A0AAE1KU24_PETCI|nr:hypothetical protein Pcinc_010055 [Petrolisthes cinctipes]